MTRAEARENLLVALDTLRSHKVRSSLTVLGIVIGVTSVISVASIIDGLNAIHSEQGRILRFADLFRFAHPARSPIRPHAGAYPAQEYIQSTDAEYRTRRKSVSRLRDYVRNARVLLRRQ